MCVFDRIFGMKQMSKWRVRCILIPDMTDEMYDSKMKPCGAESRVHISIPEKLQDTSDSFLRICRDLQD
jgi:hypothetical protein